MQNRARTVFRCCCLICLLFTARAALAQADVVAAAEKFIATLDTNARRQACFTWQDAGRFHWHFVPMERKGLPLAAMSPQQKAAALALLQACTSQAGYKKATDIIALEIVLKALEQRGPDDHYRDPGKYYCSLFGTPGAQQPWAWRLEGHHVSLNFTLKGKRLVAGTPAFLGSNPAIVPQGPQKGKQVLKQEAVLALELLHALDKAQLQQAVISAEAPREIFTGNRRKAMQLDPPGLAYTKMTPAQQQLLKQLVAVYVDNYTKLMADVLLKEISDAGWENMHFAWAGGQQWGQGHYYRLQNPAVLIEYDNTQNNGNHVHTVLRDLKNDFGDDVLQQHYESAHVQ